ncbi:hypothetical protein J9M50_002536 [Salmonella enterica]|nr:hypothetical protein [Salmonella enterica]EHI9909023.1 hypothetical protein [Salmonella enterica]EHJ0909170.1 hypothetical protein [Salmonella enterica]
MAGITGINPLEEVKIKKLVGFKHLIPGVIYDNWVTSLKRFGIDAVTGYTSSASEASIGQMSVLSNTFYGLKVTTPHARPVASITFNITDDAGSLKNHAIQMGLRLTQSAVSRELTINEMLTFSHYSNVQMTQKITPLTEDSSAYYEIVCSMAKDNYGHDAIDIEVFVNKQAVSSGSVSYAAGKGLSLTVGRGFIPNGDGFTWLIGDMYIAELTQDSDGFFTPQLLGNLTLEPFTVASYTGDKHTNTLNNDIVTALNTLGPNNDLGALAIKPVEQPASVTFNVPDIAGKSILGAALNIVYKDSIAPNNRLSYQITEGTTQLPAETITARNADLAGYTTFSKILTTPEGGGAWNAENLKFKLDIMNKGGE